MKGRKQVKFYMLPEDERQFLRYVLADSQTALLACTSTDRVLPIIKDPFSEPPQRSRLTVLLLWNRSFPIDEADLCSVKRKEYREQVCGYEETGETLYYLEPTETPVIEFRPSFLDANNRLVRGGIWAEMYRLKDQQLVYKGNLFESWYDNLATWLRQNLKRISGVAGYMGAEALRWYRLGGQLREQ